MGIAAATLAIYASAAPAAPAAVREALLARKSSTPVIARYEIDEGGVFILDRSTPRPLLKFEDDPEIFVLQPSTGPRGDTIFKNDVDEPMLRATRLGGMTVFTVKRPTGSAAALEGASPPLRIQPLSPTGLLIRFYQASIRASRAAQHQVGFETREDATPATAALLADAAMVTSEALVAIAARPDGRGVLSRISDVMIAQGPNPSVTLQRGVLTVTIDFSEGIAGRPSSRRIQRVAWIR
ncbi:MAG: DUF4908 domain-containing protein [Caulobacterales bacterium]